MDFKAIYYGARCVVRHADPYKPADFLRVYQAEGGRFPSDPAQLRLFRPGVTVCINLPTSLLLVAPFALLPWRSASLLWTALMAATLTLSALLVWGLARKNAPRISLFLVWIILANTEILFARGNAAGIAVGLCAIAAWCFLEERFVPAGVVCMAIALATKPQDVGLVWLYFLLAGGACRKRALLALLPVALLALTAAIWISPAAPHWTQELHANVAATSAQGGINDPGPESINRVLNGVIDLQSVVSIFRDDPRFYNPFSYLVCAAIFAAFAVPTLRSPFSKRQAWIALAGIAALSMLPVYHRVHDAELLLLTVPGCAILWAEEGIVAWLALLLNTAAIMLTAGFPLLVLDLLTKNFHGYAAGFGGRLLAVLLMRPAVPVLFLMSAFYLWAYLRHIAPESGRAEGKAQNQAEAPGQAARKDAPSPSPALHTCGAYVGTTQEMAPNRPPLHGYWPRLNRHASAL